MSDAACHAYCHAVCLQVLAHHGARRLVLTSRSGVVSARYQKQWQELAWTPGLTVSPGRLWLIGTAASGSGVEQLMAWVAVG